MPSRKHKEISDLDRTAILEALQGMPSAHSESVFALLYGSMVAPVIPGKYGDIDAAIYVRPDQLEMPRHVFESGIEAEAYRLLSTRGLNFPPVNRALKRAGIKNFHFHDLRHTFNTNMRKAGVDQTVIMKLTGHKTLSMFNRYNTVDQEDAVGAMKRLDLFLTAQKSLESSDQVQTATF